MAEPLFLKPDVRVEPRIACWYAWVHMLPPATAAMNLVERQTKLMRSYVASPALHAAAVERPEMRGGPFLDLGGKRRDEVAALLEQTQRQTLVQAEFARAIHELDALLRAARPGAAVEPLYARVPTPLRGLVELYLDRAHRAGFRLLEPLLYASPIYDESLQSVALSSVGAEDRRAFVFSTPRLEAAEELCLNRPLASPVLDELFSLRSRPQPLARVAASLELDDADTERLATMLTPVAPTPRPAYEAERLRVRYFGHACVLIEYAGASLLIDPLISYAAGSPPARFDFRDLPERIDAIAITHGHHDHFVIETLIQLRGRVERVIIPRNVPGAVEDPSLALLLRELGFAEVYSPEELERFDVGRMRVRALPFLGEHHDLHIATKLGYRVEVDDASAMFIADACNVEPELYRRLTREFGPVDALFLGMESKGAPLSWVYAPLIAEKLAREDDQARRGRGSNADEAWAMVEALDCREIYVYAMGEEPWVQHLLDLHYAPEATQLADSDELVRRCRASGRRATRLVAKHEMELCGRER